MVSSTSIKPLIDSSMLFSRGAFTMVELTFLTFNISKTHFIYFNTPLYNMSNINGSFFLFFFNASFKYSFFIIFYSFFIFFSFLLSPLSLSSSPSLSLLTHTYCHHLSLLCRPHPLPPTTTTS